MNSKKKKEGWASHLCRASWEVWDWSRGKPAHCKLPGGFSRETTSRLTKQLTAARLNTCALCVAPSSIFQTSAIKMCFLSYLDNNS